MKDASYLRLQVTVFTLVSAAFTNIYITQPVLPVLQQEFAAYGQNFVDRLGRH